MSKKCVRKAKKFKKLFEKKIRKASFSLALMLAFSFFGYISYKSICIPLPSAKSPILFYTNSTHSLRHLVVTALKKAKKSIELSSYALTDEPVLITILKKNIPYKILTDHKTLPKNFRVFQEKLPWELRKTKGLMHEKILLIDSHTTYLGSANMTYESLKIHENLIIGIYNEAFTKALSKNTFGIEKFHIEGMDVTFCRLPCKKEKPSLLIKELIDQASSTIDIAMFTLTHKELINSLIKAKERGVSIKIYLDRTSSNGASKKAFEKIKSASIPVFTNVGQELLHHKMMLVDGSVFVLGSANWTGSAFAKNQDFFLIINPLKEVYRKRIRGIFCRLAKKTKLK
ncbi:MAG: Cardiolipin synthase [Chlamydiia bacterium]|nr:Cardiolipin synthase [Chlamydiia bacterium]